MNTLPVSDESDRLDTWGFPDGWQIVDFGRAVSIAEGQVDPRDPAYASLPHVGPENVESATGRLLGSRRAGELGLISGKYLFQPGDVVYSKIRPYLRKSVFVDFHGLCSADMYPLKVRDEFDARYVHYFTLTDRFTSQAVSQQDRTGIPKLNRDQLSRILITKPTLGEQQAIASMLATIQAAVGAQECIVGTLKELKAATMAKLFREGLGGEKSGLRETRFGEVPGSWDTLPLGEVAYIQTGVAKGRKLEGGVATVEVPYLRVANVQDGYLDLAEIKTIELRESEVERYALQVGDVLLTEGGDFDKLGRGYMWSGQIGGCVHQNHIFAVRADRGRLPPDFFAYLAQSPYGKAYFLSVANKTTNLAPINSSKLKAFPVLVPPLDEQARIGATLRKLDEALDADTRRLDRLNTLFSSMLRQLMTGQVRVPGVSNALPNAAGDPMRRFVSELAQRFDPKRVILFGEYAEGSPKAFGEVGLLVEMDFAGLARDQAARISWEVPHDFSLDLVVRRPDDIRRAIDAGDRFIGGIFEKGRVLYERPPGEARPPQASMPEARAGGRPRHTLSEETLAEIVRRIVEAVQPEKIILFGSAARGEMGPDSDLDFLVVKSCANRREVARTIYRSLQGMGFAKDIVVVTPEDVERDRDTIGYIIRPALREGRVVYAA